MRNSLMSHRLAVSVCWAVMVTADYGCTGAGAEAKSCEAGLTLALPDGTAATASYCASHSLSAQFEFDLDAPPEMRNVSVWLSASTNDDINCGVVLTLPYACAPGVYAIDGAGSSVRAVTFDCAGVPNAYEFDAFAERGFVRIDELSAGDRPGFRVGESIESRVRGFLSVEFANGARLEGEFSVQDDIMGVDAEGVSCASPLGDRDGDGEISQEFGGADCDDSNARVNSLQNETCNRVDDDCDGEIDEGLSSSGAESCTPTGYVGNVDILIMIDNSGSMSEEQASLGTELPRLVRVLTSGDRTGDGPTPDDFEAVKNLHVGVVTSDMGVGGFNVPTCTRAAMFGDDGLLRTVGNTSVTGCMATYPRFLEYVPGVSPQTPEAFGVDFRCVAAAGTTGCGFEQQLEATLKAVTPSTSSISFFNGTRGHGDGANAGFIRPDSVLAVIVVTDEEDCSVRAGFEDLFNESSGTYTGDLNLRCFLYKEPQHPVQRYIDGFKALRVGQESLLVFGAIAGVPLDLVRGGTPNYDRILADPRMVEAVDTMPSTSGARLTPSCNVPGRGVAFPPRRIVEVARGFGENGIVQSICQDSYTAALDAVVEKIARAL